MRSDKVKQTRVFGLLNDNWNLGYLDSACDIFFPPIAATFSGQSKPANHQTGKDCAGRRAILNWTATEHHDYKKY
jgi:hypothetical protein